MTYKPDQEVIEDFRNKFNFNRMSVKRLGVKKYRAVYRIGQDISQEAIEHFILALRKEDREAVREEAFDEGASTREEFTCCNDFGGDEFDNDGFQKARKKYLDQ